MGDEPDEDPDRAAILARRQRFIALALSGLAGAAACDKPASSPTVPAGQDGGKADDAGTPDDGGDATESADDGSATTGEPVPRPQVCLMVVAPPQPCLDMPAPQPCLDVAAPHPCLEVAVPPQPCLQVVAPPPAKPPPSKPPSKPAPCLDVGPPQPPVVEQPPTAPRPCLKVSRPRPRVCLNMIIEQRADGDDDDDA